jgi:hypothetical protein
MQVPGEETFPKVLEQRLNQSGRGPAEVIDASCSGYGTDNELLFYRNEARRYRPDVVLLAFNTWNDFLENYTPLMRRAGFPYPRKPYFRRDGSRGPE